ncbi:hypothetical protein Q1695_005435 [Nippostrongylus brasiliensis]|nr:hypothetical protein Q1695_005435 [Nippostrongylus brasiliensis]
MRATQSCRQLELHLSVAVWTFSFGAWNGQHISKINRSNCIHLLSVAMETGFRELGAMFLRDSRTAGATTQWNKVYFNPYHNINTDGSDRWTLRQLQPTTMLTLLFVLLILGNVITSEAAVLRAGEGSAWARPVEFETELHQKHPQGDSTNRAKRDEENDLYESLRPICLYHHINTGRSDRWIFRQLQQTTMLTLLFVLLILGNVITSEAAVLRAGECTDRSPPNICRSHEKRGHCTAGGDWLTLMKQNCRKTCKLC